MSNVIVALYIPSLRVQMLIIGSDWMESRITRTTYHCWKNKENESYSEFYGEITLVLNNFTQEKLVKKFIQHFNLKFSLN